MCRLIVLIVIITILSITYPLMTIEDAVLEECSVVFHMPYEIYLPNAKTIKGGLGYDVIVPTEYLLEYRPKLKDSLGESLYINSSYENQANDYLKNLDAQIISLQELEENILIYAYSRHLRECVMIEDKKVNIQIAITPERIIIGTPLIIGSF